MQKRYQSLYFSMFYEAASGLSLLLIPNLLLIFLGFEPTQEIWIRILGLLVFILSIYYAKMAKFGNDEVVVATVYGRTLFCLTTVLFVVLSIGKPMLLAFGFMELVFAAWTWREIKKR